MKISVLAKPKSKVEYIKVKGETNFIVAIKELAEKGRANQAIIKALAEFFNIPPSSIVLISGLRTKQKIFEIPLNMQDLISLQTSLRQIKLL
ncbi:DUF167 domain-containing protein [Candidatus Daviesbacteria bacterium]|nr:DUF167 domain-containing protein [Candidatus Daviesbacteria bacterium]